MKTILSIGLLAGIAALCGQILPAEPQVILTKAIDATPPPVVVRGIAVLTKPGKYTCHNGALGVRIHQERGQRRLEVVFDQDTPASHSMELAVPPVETEWFVVPERADRVWCATTETSILCVDWQRDPASGKRVLKETKFILPKDVDALKQAEPPEEVSARLVKHWDE